jgi:hypothetical protein
VGCVGGISGGAVHDEVWVVGGSDSDGGVDVGVDGGCVCSAAAAEKAGGVRRERFYVYR